MVFQFLILMTRGKQYTLIRIYLIYVTSSVVELDLI